MLASWNRKVAWIQVGGIPGKTCPCSSATRWTACWNHRAERRASRRIGMVPLSQVWISHTPRICHCEEDGKDSKLPNAVASYRWGGMLAFHDLQNQHPMFRWFQISKTCLVWSIRQDSFCYVGWETVLGLPVRWPTATRPDSSACCDICTKTSWPSQRIGTSGKVHLRWKKKLPPRVV